MQRIEEGKCFPGNKIEDHGCSIEIEETRTAWWGEKIGGLIEEKQLKQKDSN